jgi:hypothetical protein
LPASLRFPALAVLQNEKPRRSGAQIPDCVKSVPQRTCIVLDRSPNRLPTPAETDRGNLRPGSGGLLAQQIGPAKDAAGAI